MQFQTDWAIKKWTLALSNDFTLDAVSFLVSSILPLVQIETKGTDNLLVVELSEIRKYTNLAKQGCDLLVKNGVAKWVNDAKGRISYDKIAVGTTNDYVSAIYYFEKTNRITQAIKSPLKTRTSRIKKTTNLTDFGDTIQILDDWYARYSVFCSKVSLHSKAEKIHDKIKNVIINVKNTGTITPVELLTYLDCVNAMIYDWTDVPNTYSNIKLRQVAKKIIAKSTADNIIRIVPYYAENYPNIAKQGYEETNIYNLDFHFTSMLMKATKGKVGKNKPKNYNDDKL